MRTTLDLDERLLNKAMSVSGEKSKKATVESGLKELIKRKRREDLRAMLGNTDFAMTWKEVHKLRENEH